MTLADQTANASEVRPGHLYVVATPIGNLGDLSPRAMQVLSQVDRICAEDTRTSTVLLSRFGISRPLQALHEHNESAVTQKLIADLQAGASLALISDAGTPLISDPGFVLVRAARAAGVPVIAVPGPCAAIAALSIAGIASDSFLFLGFLPAKAAARRQSLQALSAESRTMLFYESSHRIQQTLADIAITLGQRRRLCLAREITKRFEQSVTLPAEEMHAWLEADANRLKGEFVLVVEGAAQQSRDQADGERLLRLLLKELPPSRAARVASEFTGQKRRELFALALECNGDTADQNAEE
ncbi:MAG: 16S rRNA (cytidine(1402)-2'-O)-methyltransferase [Panacagrimonas sp.]